MRKSIEIQKYGWDLKSKNDSDEIRTHVHKWNRLAIYRHRPLGHTIWKTNMC